MKLLTFLDPGTGEEVVGVLTAGGGGVVAARDLGVGHPTMMELVARGTPQELERLRAGASRGGVPVLPLDQVVLAAPIPRPAQDILCLGINYLDHAEESARFKKEAFDGTREYPVYFSKRVNRAVGSGEGIPSHASLVDSLDYEAELAVIIGREARGVSREEAYDYVFGYTILNDISARNIQTRHKQWYFGKSLDGFAPMGPWIVTADEIAAPPVLTIQSRVNGELRQNSTTDKLMFDIAYVISQLSQGMTLQPGTILAMGTPAGVGMGFVPPRFLRPGDVVECTIQGIGTLKNTILE